MPIPTTIEYRGTQANRVALAESNRKRKARESCLRAYLVFAIVAFATASARAAAVPEILSPPTSLTVNEGDTAYFYVTATGEAPLSYQWMYDFDSPLTDRQGIAGSRTAALTISNVQPQQSGIYSVVVSNAAGTATRAAFLWVQQADRDHDGLRDSWELMFGLNPALPSDACLDLDGDGADNLHEYWAFTDPHDSNSLFAAQIEIERDLVCIDSRAPVFGLFPLALLRTHSLEVPVIWEFAPGGGVPYCAPLFGQAGFYRLLFFDRIPLLYSGNVVGYLSYFLQPGQVTITNELSHPDPRIDNVIPDAPDGTCVVKGLDTNCFITFFGWENPDMTLARGDVFDVVTPPSASWNLTLSGEASLPPDYVIGPSNQTVVAGMHAAFEVSTDGTEPLFYQWQFHGTNLPGANCARLGWTNVQPERAGPYTVVITNTSGAATSQVAVLTVTPPPLLRLSAPTLQPGRMRFDVEGTPGARYIVQASPDLSEWLWNATNVSPFSLTVLVSSNAAQRFFRAVPLP